MPLVLWLAVVFLSVLSGCSSTPKRASLPEPAGPFVPAEPAMRAAALTAQGDGCIVVPTEGATASAIVEGQLAASSGSAGGGPSLMLLRLARPRCVVGLPRASYLTEVYVASTGPDLRPLLGQAVRISGNAIGGANDLGGPALVILAQDVERVVASDAPR